MDTQEQNTTAPKETERKTKLWSFDFVLVLLISMLSTVISQGSSNGLPIYVAFEGGNNSYSGVLIFTFCVSAMLTRVVLSAIIDRSKRRTLIEIGAIITLIGAAGPIFFPNIDTLMFFRVFQGVGFGMCTTSATTAAADIVPLQRLGEGLGYFGLGQSLGMVIGPSLAIVLVTMAYHQALFVGMTILAIVLLVCSVACRYENHAYRLDPDCAYRLALRKRQSDIDKGTYVVKQKKHFSIKEVFELKALPGALPMVVICLGYSIVTTFVSKYGVDQGFVNPGFFFLFSAVSMTLVRFFGARLIDTIRWIILMLIAVVCGIVCFLLLIFAQNVFLFYAAGAFFGISLGVSSPLLNTIAIFCSPLDRRGAASALFMLGNDLGVGLGAVIAGSIIDVLGYISCFWIGAGFVALSFVTSLLIFPRYKSRKD